MARMTNEQLAALQTTIGRLEHTLALAKLAAAGEEPETGALYVLETLEDLEHELRGPRAGARGRRGVTGAWIAMGRFGEGAALSHSGRCHLGCHLARATQKKKGRRSAPNIPFSLMGAAGFEPATPAV